MSDIEKLTEALQDYYDAHLVAVEKLQVIADMQEFDLVQAREWVRAVALLMNAQGTDVVGDGFSGIRLRIGGNPDVRWRYTVQEANASMSKHSRNVGSKDPTEDD
jgi:hypothetical protein